MKMKAMVVSMLSVGLVFGTLSLANATSWITASVNRTSTTNGTVQVMLRYDSGDGCTWGGSVGNATNVWFALPTAMNDQALAVALTAISLGKTVRVGVETCPDTTTSLGGTISSIGLDQ